MSRVKSTSIEGAPIVGVTGTYYPDPGDIRLEIALDTAKGWSEQELPLIVVDGFFFKPPGCFLKALARFTGDFDDWRILI